MTTALRVLFLIGSVCALVLASMSQDINWHFWFFSVISCALSLMAVYADVLYE